MRRHYDRIHRLCRRIIGNEADAFDATQEALIAITRGIRIFDGRAAFSTWSYRVATNACLDELRRRARRPTPGLPTDRDDVPEQGTPLEPSASQAAIDGLADRMVIDAALAQLAEDFRVAVVLRDVCDLDYAAIAEVLDIPPGTVRSRIARGRSQLADLLERWNQTTEDERPTKRSSTPHPPRESRP